MHPYLHHPSSPLSPGGQCRTIDPIVRPGGRPSLHTHSREDKHLTALEGKLTFLSGGRERLARPGDDVFAPRTHPHTLPNRTPAPARTLIHTAPAGIQRMFHELGSPLPPASTAPPPPTPESITNVIQICPTNGITLHLG